MPAMLAAPVARTRLVVVAVLLAAQSLYFVHWCARPLTVVSDNIRYEEPGWLLARTGTLAMPYTAMPDDTVRGWVCGRHPDACRDGAYPTAAYPPGYSVLIAGLYVCFGRALLPIVIVQWLLLCGMFVVLEALAFRFLDGRGYWFTMAVAATYPFLARQASMIMSDHLHAALLMYALGALLLMRPGWARGLVFGALLAAATLVRPYSIVVIPVLYLWPAVRRSLSASRAEWLLSASACLVPMVAWALRNAYWFGRFIPLTTTGLGPGMYTLVLEWKLGHAYDATKSVELERLLTQYGDPTIYAPNRRLMSEAATWLRGHPLALAALLAAHLPKVWISLGAEGQGLSRAAPLIFVYLGGLLLLGIVGMWLMRRQRYWYVLVGTIVPYWLFVAAQTMEARRTLPLRLPMLLLAGGAVSTLVARWRARSDAAA
jgi:hypothetical protein